MSSSVARERILKRANPSTIQDKFLVGYQGWFTCGGDGEPVGPGHHGWLHWMNCPIPDGGHPNIDLWPDVSDYSPSELFSAPGLKYSSGDQAFLFSSRHPKTVQRHFNWMAKHGVDGAFLQRFATEVDVDAGSLGIRRIRDEVGQRVREAAEKEGRVFAIMYDVTGLPANRVLHVIQNDWTHLIRNQGLLDSPNYLREKQKAVVALWGFGFDNAGHSPDLVRAVCNFLSQNTPGGVYIVAGVPTHWRTHTNDADRNPGFMDVWMNHFDAISPWTVGRFKDEEEADHFSTTVMKVDVEHIKKNNDRAEFSGGKKIDYIPVVFPGFSGYNMTQGKWEYNGIKRNGGKFLWKQISNARRLGVRTMYGAMWDEYDEGTALMPVIEKKRLLPKSDKFPFLALDEDGFDLPSDWYMRICGFAAEGLRSERRIHDSFPSKELQDYWASRPKYEEVDVKCGEFVSSSSSGGGGGSGGGDGQSYEDWLSAQKEKEDGPPPPPYTLEAEEPEPSRQPQQATPNISTGTPSVPVQVEPQPQSPPSQEPSQPQIHLPTNHSGPSQAAGALQAMNQAINTHFPNPPYQHPVSGSTYPSSYPQGQPITGAIVNDPIASLTNDFGRQSISSSGPISGPGIPPTSPNLQSRPPLHPSHPSAQNRPPRPSSQQGRPPTASPPTSKPTSPGPIATSFPNHHQQTQPPHASQGGWSQAQWPPPDWQVNRPTQSSPPQQHQQPYNPVSYPGNSPSHHQQYQTSYPTASFPDSNQPTLGANLSRPNSYTAGYGQQSNRPPSRPHASIGHGPRPTSSQSPEPASQPPQSPTYGAYPPSLASGPPTTYPGSSSSSTYPGQVSTYPGQSSYGPSQPGSSSYPGGPSFPTIPTPFGPTSGYGSNVSSYPGQSSYGPSPSPSPHDTTTQNPSPYGLPGPSFPEVPSLGAPQQSYPPNDYGASQPQLNSFGENEPNNSWQNTPPPPSPAPPPMPPRPPTTSQNSASFFPTPSTSSTSSGAFGFALSAVDRVAGRDTRAQLENLAQTGTKFFKKMTR